MPKPIVADPKGTASVLNLEAMGALARGDTALAQQKRKEAGEILERRMKAVSRAREKHYLRFLAATQFYKGGLYQRASDLAEQIDPKLLDARARELLPPFLKDVRERSSPGYLGRMRAKMDVLWNSQDWKAVLELLAEHQYFLTPGGSAWVRGVCCLQLGEPKASAIFFAQAVRHPEAVALSLQQACSHVLDLAVTDRRDDAQRYAGWLKEFMPSAAVSAAVAFAEYAKLVHAPEAERDSIIRAQIAAMDLASAGADELLASVDGDLGVRRLLTIAAGATALTCRWYGDDERATAFRQLAIRLDQEKAIGMQSWFRHWDQIRESPTPLTPSLLERAREVARQTGGRVGLPEFTNAA